jgi:RND family efflux transporter MFP subunit
MTGASTSQDHPKARHRYRRWTIGLVGAGVVGFILLMLFRPQPGTDPPPARVPTVSVVRAESHVGALAVRGNGTVRPSAQVTLSAEVPGRVVWASGALVSGGRFRRGQVLVQLDSADYENAVEAARADVAARRVELLQAQQEAAIAREEYRRLQEREGAAAAVDSTAFGSLVFREPQLRAAQAALRGAETRLEDASLALQRTRVPAPFDGVVRVKNVDVGQYVTPGMGLATVYSSADVEVVVPLSPDRAALIPELWDARPGGQEIGARVHADVAGVRHSWSGYVDRAEAALDERTRTVNVVVKVAGAFDTRMPDGEAAATQRSRGIPTGRRPPLVLGTYVAVEIEGVELERYYSAPRAGLRDDDVFWIVEGDTLLVLRRVTPIQESEGVVQVLADFMDAPLVVVSALPVVTDSMTVRVLGTGDSR